MHKLDDAEWHFDATPEDEPDERRWAMAGAHIALFARWLGEKGWMVPLLEDNGAINAASLTALRVGGMTGTKFVESFTDWKLFAEMVDEEARPFIVAYVDEGGAFADDVQALMGSDAFRRTEDEYDYSKFARRFEARHSEYQSGDQLRSASLQSPKSSTLSSLLSMFRTK